MVDFHAAAVRFGKPGKLYIAPLGTTEPTTETAAWPTGWVPLGYTNEGSNFTYNINTDNVEVAEELDILARVTTGRDASVEFAMAELTYKNLSIAFNGGIIAAQTETPASSGHGPSWTFEPPDLGNEVRVMLGWDAYATVGSNDLRFIFRQCLQGGSISIENRKGATKSTVAVNFQLEKPASPAGTKILKILGAGTLNPL